MLVRRDDHDHVCSVAFPVARNMNVPQTVAATRVQHHFMHLVILQGTCSNAPASFPRDVTSLASTANTQTSDGSQQQTRVKMAAEAAAGLWAAEEVVSTGVQAGVGAYMVRVHNSMLDRA